MNTQDNRFLQQTGNAKAKVGDVLARALFGEEIAQPETMVINNDGVYSFESGVNNGGRKGGLVNFINDARNGMLENSSQGFQAQNLYPDKEKGTGYRFGEAVGSALRLLDNPLVRGGIAYGLSKRMGDENPLGEALTAANLTRQNRLKDQMYRNELAKMDIDTLGIRGFIDDDTFSKIFQSKQLQDNAAYRKMYYDMQAQNQKEMMEYRKQEADRKARQDELDNYYKGQQIAQGWEKLKQDAKGAEGNNKGDLIFNQLELLEKAFANMPQSKAIVGSKGKAVLTGVTNKIGLRNDDVTAYEAIRNPLVTTLARTIAGEKGVLTDKDFARAEKMVPTSFDSAEQAEAKFKEIKKLVGVSLGGLPVATSSQPSLNVNRNALEAEMKRRGLK